jgi:hypothetical protein
MRAWIRRRAVGLLFALALLALGASPLLPSDWRLWLYLAAYACVIAAVLIRARRRPVPTARPNRSRDAERSRGGERSLGGEKVRDEPAQQPGRDRTP